MSKPSDFSDGNPPGPARPSPDEKSPSKSSFQGAKSNLTCESESPLSIASLLHREHQSRCHQSQLERTISLDSAEYQKLRAHCFHLERTVCQKHHQSAQLQYLLAYTQDASRSITRDLNYERSKVQELETRLNELYQAVGSWARTSNIGAYKMDDFNTDDTKEQLTEENKRQRNLIGTLQYMLQTREKMVQELRVALDRLKSNAHAGKFEQNQSDVTACMAEDDDESSVEIIT